MMVALRDYVCTNGFPGVILGLSGGIDSALSAAVAVDALGADKVWCVMLPSKYTSDDSLEDAAECARLLGVRHDVNDLLVEGGSATATAFLSEDLVDRILIYRAPIIVGEGKSSFGYVGLDAIADAHAISRHSG